MKLLSRIASWLRKRRKHFRQAFAKRHGKEAHPFSSDKEARRWSERQW